MGKDKLYEYAESIRRELHELVDRKIDNFLQRRENEKLAVPFEHTWSLNMPTSYFKGMKPISVCLPDGEKVSCKTWREVAAVILQDCNQDAKMHEMLIALSGKVAGRERTILGRTDAGMNKPIRIDDGIYFESYFDTEYLLKMMKERVLDRVGYDSGAVRLQIREPGKALSPEQKTAQPTPEELLTEESSEEETDEEQGFSLMM